MGARTKMKTPSIWNWARRRCTDHWIHPDEVRAARADVPPGALLLIYGKVGETERVKHAGFVEEVDGRIVRTVEGNTDLVGSREGGGVFRLGRPVESIYRFVLVG